jgi:uncharacterized protein (TIGR03435 family)
MSHVAAALSNIAHPLVLDRTNLPGTFDFRVRWTRDSHDAALSAALREQLGSRSNRRASRWTYW